MPSTDRTSSPFTELSLCHLVQRHTNFGKVSFAYFHSIFGTEHAHEIYGSIISTAPIHSNSQTQTEAFLSAFYLSLMLQ